MLSLVAGTVFFVCLHLFVSGSGLRDQLTDRIGEGPYLGLFSLASLGGFVWMCNGYAGAPYVQLWSSLPGIRSIALVTTLIAFLLAVIGLTTKSPTATGGEALLDEGDVATGILRITRHPFLWGVIIWSATHMLTTGDLASLIFFGGLLILGIYGPKSIDGKRERKLGEKWEAFAKVTSRTPFAAIREGRNHLALAEIPVWKIIAGVAMWSGMIAAHAKLFGTSPLG
jgi:uncharacterized membrane protein